MNKYTTQQLEKYQEILFKSEEKNHIFYFELNGTIKGFYLIDGQDRFYLSVCAMKQIMMNHLPNIKSKYFNLSFDEQKEFVLIEDQFSKCSEEIQMLIDLITSNKRKGTPRKFILNKDAQRVNIELKTYFKNNFINL